LDHCFRFGEMEPQYPWQTFARFASMAMGDRVAGRATLAALVAKQFLARSLQTNGRALEWTKRYWAMEVWVSRNLTRSMALGYLAEAPPYRPLLEGHDCSAARAK
jgi:hypothetical protein